MSLSTFAVNESACSETGWIQMLVQLTIVIAKAPRRQPVAAKTSEIQSFPCLLREADAEVVDRDGSG
jgi:hypothetical protein